MSATPKQPGSATVKHVKQPGSAPVKKPATEGLRTQRLPEPDDLARLHAEISSCRACDRLVAWREEVAVEKRLSYREQTYWGRAVPGFGDPNAELLVLGLAPAAHGANRTGRVFTGDRSGDWLFRAMYRAGFANQPTSTSVDDGLVLQKAYVAAAVRCAPPENAPTSEERDRCLPFLRREVGLLPRVKVIVVLGQFAYDVMCRELAVKPKPKFGHGVEAMIPSRASKDSRLITMLCSFHPSQQNTFTGKLTEAMLDAIFDRANALIHAGTAITE